MKGKKTKNWAIFLIILCTLVTASGQLFLKLGADKLKIDFLSLITNYVLIIGCIIYFFGAILLITALRGGEVSVLYPLFATSYIWVTLIAKYVLHEDISLFKWIGVGTIIIGVIFISLGSE
mgnify:CR=1 FL=1